MVILVQTSVFCSWSSHIKPNVLLGSNNTADVHLVAEFTEGPVAAVYVRTRDRNDDPDLINMSSCHVSTSHIISK